MEETLTYMVAMLVRLLVNYSPSSYCILLDGVSMCLTNDASCGQMVLEIQYWPK